MIFLNFCFVAGSCVAIVEVNFFEADIKEWFGQVLKTHELSDNFSILIDFMPVIVVAGLNALMIPVTNVISNLENWDFNN